MHDKKSMVRLSNDLRDKIIVTNGALNYYIWPQKKKKKKKLYLKKSFKVRWMELARGSFWDH